MIIKKYTVLAACLLVFGTFNVSYADYMMGSQWMMSGSFKDVLLSMD